MTYLIGVDIGTSATKAVLIDETGNIKAQASAGYPMYEPANGWAEQDPLDWKKAVLSAVKKIVEASKVNKEDVAGIGLTGQMHGLVMLDESCQPMGRSIIWCDQRSGRQAQKMKEMMSLEKWLDITSNPPLAGWTAAKIMWVRENRPEVYAKCKKILLPKDYIRYVLTGAFATDVSDATGMQLLDVKNRCWSDTVLELLNIPRELLGNVYESQEVTGTLLPEIAEELGLSENTVVVAGASDNAAAAIGTGVVREGQAFTTIGTSAVVYSHLDHYAAVPEGGLHLCCCAVPGCYHTMGGPQSAGLSLEWFKEKFCQDFILQALKEGRNIHEVINQMTKEIPIGSDKLIFLPFLLGERTPHMEPDYRGAFVGLSNIHSQGHLLRAIMEGVAYCLADCNNILKELGVSITDMRVCGGGSRSPVWQKILADLYRCDIHTMQQEEGPAYGAAILAGVGAGAFSDIPSACDRFIKEDKTIQWNETEAAKYRQYHQIYDRIYEHLKTDFSALAKT
ncbi:MAG: xylulokinase [Lachnospiraceae bacterium]|nr:xylulokinase [Lachnospiraceae bacterium]